MKPRLVFFLGGAGAGKTTAAKALAARRRAAVFDMDTRLRPAAEALMTLAGLDPSDRESDAYQKLCRELGYRITMDAALENVAVGTDAFVIGLAMTRSVLANPPMTNLSREELSRWAGPVYRQLLDGPTPSKSQVRHNTRSARNGDESTFSPDAVRSRSCALLLLDRVLSARRNVPRG